MTGLVGGSSGTPSTAGTGGPTASPLVGRHDVLGRFARLLDGTGAGGFRFAGLAGEPGAGKTRLLGELAPAARARRFATLWGRAAEFEQEMPFAAVIDALDDHLEGLSGRLPGRLGVEATRLLATVFPALSSALSGDPGPAEADSGRYRLYRTIRRLLEEVAAPSGLALILDDLHWADESTVELLDHLVRHPPRGRVLITVAYRPAQASPRLSALMETVPRIPVGPLTEDEVDELLGPEVSRARRRALYQASGGNPFYLEALARMGPGDGALAADEPDELGELPPAVRAALRMELSGLSPDALLVAQAAAVAADEFDPALAAVTAEVSEGTALEAINELVARDVVRPAAPGRFRFRHPLVRHAAYGSAAAGWRHAAHARIARRLADLRAPATVRARHVERSARIGDQAAIATLVEAARTVAAQAPATAAHWLRAALDLVPEDPETRLDLLLELARAQWVSGRLTEGKETARELLRLLPPDDHRRRARAARMCGVMERQLDRPHEARALLLDELQRIADPRAPAAVELRVRLVAESLKRSDFRAAQAVLDLMPGNGEGWEPGLVVAVAALRPMSAYAAGRVGDAVRYADAAGRLVSAAPDAHLAEWLDTDIWLGWLELMIGRYGDALRHFDRFLTVARTTGQSFVLPHILSGQARTLTLLGRLADAAAAAEEAAEVSRLLNSGEALVFAMTQQCLAASWSGDHESALRFGDEAVRLGLGVGRGEWWGAMARYARSRALINAGRLEEGAEAVLEACDGFSSPRLDPDTLIACCEALADVAAARGRHDEAAAWADRMSAAAFSDLPVGAGFTRLARAHALASGDPGAAAEHARAAAEVFESCGRHVDAGRARLRAGIAFAAAGDRGRARTELGEAAAVFAACGAHALHAQAVREQRRAGARVPSGGGGRGPGPYGLTRRETEVAMLVVAGHTNQQIAEKLFVSVRTVETHLSHIFTKLGVTSRVGVVSVLSRRT